MTFATDIRRPGALLPWLCLALLLCACGKAPELPPLSKDDVVLAFGDSLTRGTGASPDESYPAVLQNLIGRTVINAGIPGEVSGNGLKRLPALLDKHRPALMILCHGGNDILRKLDLDQAEKNILEMISLARERGATVVLIGVPKPGLFLSSAELYDRIAEAADIMYLDEIVPDVLGDNAMKSDPVHPNGAGYRAIAEHLHAALSDAGAI